LKTAKYFHKEGTTNSLNVISTSHTLCHSILRKLCTGWRIVHYRADPLHRIW